MRVLILGCGYLGSKLAERFRVRGDFVTATTTTESKVGALEKIADHVVLLSSSTPMENILKDQDVVVVCVAPNARSDYESTYLQIAKRVQKALSKEPRVKNLIYTSSCSVYGEKQGQWVSEEHALEPLTEDQQILVETEKIYLNQLNPSVRVSVFRLGELYGLEKSMEKRVAKLAGSHFPSNGENFTNLIHVKDVVRAVEWALRVQAVGIYNLCNDCHQTRKDFYRAWCQALGLDHVKFDPSKKSAHRGNKRVSNQKIKLMGFSFEHADSIPKSLD